MDEDDPKLALAQRRYLMLLRQVLEEAGGLEAYGAKSAAARKLGIDQPHVSQFIHGKKSAGLKTIYKTMEKMGLRQEFFFDPNADVSSYRRFQRVELVRHDEAGHPVIEAYLEAMEGAGTPVLPRHKEELRSLRAALGPDSITIEVVKGTHRGLIARDANRAIEAPIVEVDLDEGQRPLPPTRKRR